VEEFTVRDNYLSIFKGQRPQWLPGIEDQEFFNPKIIPDNIARAMVRENIENRESYRGGKDMFGVEWTFVPQVNGSMVKGGHPLLTDVNDWEEKIHFPDIDSYDWSACQERNRGVFFGIDKPVNVNIVSGIFERLISFMDFQNALLALVDEDGKDALKALFSRLCDFYDHYIELIAKYLHPDVIEFHDDWGSQRAPLFSLQTCQEMIQPYLKRVVDACHRNGLLFQMHSCGKIEPLVPVFVEAGIDIWYGQYVNDFDSLIQQYGDKFIFGVVPEALPADVSDEQADESGRKFAEKYCPYYEQGKPIAVFSRRCDPRQVKAIEKYSRKYFSEHRG
jgi:hypothetical protein